jgi:thiol-disulfide isomerase/thioredoxin
MGVTACNGLEGTGDKGFVTGDGVIATLAVDDRESAVVYEGDTVDGGQLSFQDLRGEVVVVNVWGSWCGPCQKEAPWVVGAAAELGDDVTFVGINVRDGSPAQAQAFERYYGTKFPSLYSPSGEALLAFHGLLSPRTIPAFVILDRDGRIAASIIGPLPSQQTLVDLTQDVVDESRDG